MSPCSHGTPSTDRMILPVPGTYDGSGNPLSYYNGKRYTFTWEEGRNLVSAVQGANTYTYAYDQNGIRVSKAENGKTHTYLYASGKLLRETISVGNTVTDTLDFFYDHNGYPCELNHTTNGTTTTYYYITNLQGDVLCMITGNGTSVASYSYDPYGKVLDTPAESIIEDINPLRYRGYYYDAETGFYYLQSRYYDPTICRFISADAFASTAQGILGLNMFAYGLNSVITAVDSSGKRTYFINGISNDGDDAPGYARAFKKEMDKQGVDGVYLIPVYTNQNNILKTALGVGQVLLEMFNISIYTNDVYNVILRDLKDNPLKEGEQLNLVGYSGGGQIALNVMEKLEKAGYSVDNVVLIGAPVAEHCYTSATLSMICSILDPLSWNFTCGVDVYVSGAYGHGGYFAEENIENTVGIIKSIYQGD